MKKVVLLLLLSSCGYAPMDNYSNQVIITKIDKSSSNACSYYGIGNTNLVSTPTSFHFKFRDTCGKFQIGDTLNIVKK